MSPTEAYRIADPAEARSAADDSRVLRAVEEYLAALEAGQAPSRAEFLGRYPDIAARLEEYLGGLDLIHRAGSAAGALAEGDDSADGLSGAEPVGDFLLLRELGRGGMGVVYEAVQRSLNRKVALKVLPFAAALDSRQLQRFKNEAQAAACLHHPHIVPVFGVGCERGVHYYAMQLIAGQTLAAMIAGLRPNAGQPASPETQSITPQVPAAATEDTAAQAAASTERPRLDRAHFRRVAELGMQAAEALDHAHSVGIVHRDIKPGNLLVDGRGSLWVTDFGLAHVQSDARLTMTGDLIGTLRYMSPEQALAKRVVVDHRTDVYSLGATLYELLTLEPAFRGDDRQELLRQIAFEEPRPARRLNRAIPGELATIVQKAMEKNPAERYATAKDLADDLRRWLHDQPIRARSPGVVRRLQKWGRRHRAVTASAIVALVLVALVASAGYAITAMALGREARAREDADNAQQREAGQRALAEEQRDTAQQNAYLFSMQVAQQAWEAGDIDRLLQILEKQRPREGQPDLRDWEWYYLLARCSTGHFALREDPPEKARPDWPTGPFVVWSPDGRRLAWVGLGVTVQVWDLTSRRKALTLRGHSQPVLCAAWSPDGKQLATGSDDFTIKLWDAATGQEIRTLTGHTKAAGQRRFPNQQITDGQRGYGIQPVAGVTSVAWSPDGTLLASASSDDMTIRLWDPTTGKVERMLTDPQANFPYQVSWSPDSRHLLSARGYTDGFRVWDVTGNEPPITLGEKKEHQSATSESFSAAWSPDGTLIAQLHGTSVHVWDLKTHQRIRTIPGTLSPVAWRPGSSELATVPQRSVIKVWDARTGQETLTLRGHRDKVTSVAWSADGKRLASASKDLVIEVWDTDDLRQGSLLPGGPWAIGFPSQDGRRLAALSDSITRGKRTRDLKAWDLQTHRELLTLPGLGVESYSSWSPDGTRLACAQGIGVTIWDVNSGKSLLELPHRAQSNVRSPAWSADGRQLATVEQHSIKVWDLTTGREDPRFRLPATYRGHESMPFGLWQAAAWSPDGQWLACAGYPGAIRIWDTRTGAEVAPLPGHDGFTGFLAWSPDSTLLISSGGEKYSGLKLWHFPTRRQLFQAPGASAGAWSPDGKRFCSIGPNNSSLITVWDRETLSEIHYLRGPTGVMWFDPGLRWSPDGRRVSCFGWKEGLATTYSWDASPGYEAANSLRLPEAQPEEVEGRALAQMGMGNALRDAGRAAEAEAAYQQALELQQDLVKRYPSQPAYRLSLARIHSNLGILFRGSGRYAEAEAALLQALSLQEALGDRVAEAESDRAATHYELGQLCQQTGRYREAVDHYHQFSKARSSWKRLNEVAWFLATCDHREGRDPALAATLACRALRVRHILSEVVVGEICNTLGVALYRAGSWEAAVAVLDSSCKLRAGGSSEDFFFLAMAHWQLGDRNQARTWYEQGVEWMERNKPQDQELRRFQAEAAALLQNEAAPHEKAALDARAHYDLGNVLEEIGQPPAAIAEYREAIRLKNDYAEAHNNLGNALARKGQLEDAIVEYREATRLKRDLAEAHGNLGHVLSAKGDSDGAIAAYQTAIRLKPELAGAHRSLGNELRKKGRLDEVITAYREAIRVKEDDAIAHCSLGELLRDQGQFTEALVCMRRGHELGSRSPGWRYPSAQWVKECERLLEVDEKLVTLLKDEIQPADVRERLMLAQLCLLPAKSLHAAAVRLYAAAFAEQPKLEADLQAQHRYNAACAAALAGTSKDTKEPVPEADKPALRRQARDWLQADLGAYARQVIIGKGAWILLVEARLVHWQADRDFVGVRDAKSLAKLPEAEQAEWRKLWADVDQLLGQARSLITDTTLKGTLTDKLREEVHELKVEAGKTYVMDMKSKALDSYLKLYDPAGKLVGENDDIAPPELDARIEFTPKEDGVHRIIATSFEQRGRGPYTLTIRAVGK